MHIQHPLQLQLVLGEREGGGESMLQSRAVANGTELIRMLCDRLALSMAAWPWHSECRMTRRCGAMWSGVWHRLGSCVRVCVTACVCVV